MVRQCAKQCITRLVIWEEKPNFRRQVCAKLFWFDSTNMTSTASRCLKKVGQKKKSDNTMNLHWKTTPMKPHLKKGNDGKGTGTLF